MGPGVTIDLAEVKRWPPPRSRAARATSELMKNRNEKQQDLDKLKTELAKVSTVILSTFPRHHGRRRHQAPPAVQAAAVNTRS